MLDGRRGAEHDPERGRLASAAPLPPGSADLGLAEQARVRAGQVGARPRGRLQLLASGTGSSCSQACALEPARSPLPGLEGARSWCLLSSHGRPALGPATGRCKGLAPLWAPRCLPSWLPDLADLLFQAESRQPRKHNRPLLPVPAAKLHRGGAWAGRARGAFPCGRPALQPRGRPASPDTQGPPRLGVATDPAGSLACQTRGRGPQGSWGAGPASQERPCSDEPRCHRGRGQRTVRPRA